MGARGDRVDLVGRDEEIASLRALVDSVATLRGQIMVVEGEGGIGKTRLMDEVLGYSKVREYRVFKSACEELERTLPFAAIGRAFGADRRSPDIRLAAIGELLVGKTSEEALPLSPGHLEQRFRVLEEVIAFVEHSASVGPTIIVIEDIHWADQSSLLALHTLGGRIAPLRVALIVTLRPTPRTPELASTLSSFRTAGAHQRFLEPLADDEVDVMLSSVVGAMPGPRLRSQAAGAGGNPLFLYELATALVDAGLVELVDDCMELREARLPSSLRQTVLRRLDFLSPATVRVLQMASILGSSFDVNDLSMCLKAHTIDFLPSLEEALSSRVIEESDERLAFRHDLLRMVIYETLPAAVRKGLHRDVGRALAAAGRPPNEVAPHMVLGASAGDQEAIRLLHRAARSIASRSPSSAVELLQRAVELVAPNDPLGDELITELVAALVWAGRPVEAEDLARAALNRSMKSDVVGNLQWALAQAVAVQGRLKEALKHTEAAVGEPRLAEGRRARLMADAAQWKFYTGDVEGSEATAEQAVMAGERHDDEVAVALGLSALSRVAMERCRFASAISLGREALRRVGERGIDKEETDWIHPSFDLGGALVVADQLSEAEKVLRAGRRLREDLGSTWDLPLFTNTLAYAHLYSGRWDDAIAESKTVLSLMMEGGARGSALWAYSLLAYVALYRDGIEASQRILDVAEREITVAGTVMGSDQILWCQALVEEGLGDVEKASQLMERAWNLKLPFKVVTQSRMGPDAVRLARLTGRDRQARSAVQDVGRLARESDVALYKGVALRCRGLLESDVRGLLTSVAVLRDSSRPLELALAAEDAGVALTTAGRPSEATPLLQEAIDAYEQLGAIHLVGRAEAALRAAGIRRGRRGKRARETKGWASLTTSEKEVVALVVQGLTNREVGARLFISRRTVETHLSHVFSKLDINSRVALAAEAARRSSPDDSKRTAAGSDSL